MPTKLFWSQKNEALDAFLLTHILPANATHSHLRPTWWIFYAIAGPGKSSWRETKLHQNFSPEFSTRNFPDSQNMGRGQLQVSQNRIYRVKCFCDISHLVDGLKNIHFYLEISYLGKCCNAAAVVVGQYYISAASSFLPFLTNNWVSPKYCPLIVFLITLVFESHRRNWVLE